MTEDERPWLPEEAAAWFRVTDPTIRRWVREGRLRACPTGGALRITARSVRALTEGYDATDGACQGTGDDHPDRGLARRTAAVWDK